jgi:hypothetical protein
VRIASTRPVNDCKAQPFTDLHYCNPLIWRTCRWLDRCTAIATQEVGMKGFVFVLALGGCATALPSSRSNLGEAGLKAQLCVSDGALRAGQTIRVLRNVCSRDPHASSVCALEPIGQGEVVRTVDERCAIVRIAMTTPAERGDRIELLPLAPASLL